MTGAHEFTRLPFWYGSGSGGGGSPPPPPEPSPEERRLQAAQANAAEQQLAITKLQVAKQEALEPFLLQGTGLSRVPAPQIANPKAGQPGEPDTIPDPNAPIQYQQDPAYAQFQADLLEFQKKQIQSGTAALTSQEKLNPLLLKQAGIEVDPVTGDYRLIEDPNKAMTEEIARRSNERTLAALKGELPVTATLQRQLAVGRQNLNEELARRLGPGYETSTAGIQAIAAYEAEATALKEAEQKDQLTTAQALALSSQEELRRRQSQGLSATASGQAGPESLYGTTSSVVDAMTNRNNDIYGRITGIGDQTRANAAALGQAGTSLGNAAAPYERYRNQVYASQVGAASLASQRAAASQNALYGGIGTGAAGLAIGGAILY